MAMIVNVVLFVALWTIATTFELATMMRVVNRNGNKHEDDRSSYY